VKYSDTTASDCRYGSVAASIFGDADIIWEDSVSGWQGEAEVLAHMPDGTFAHYGWTYGSCSGCDDWEYRGLSDGEIEAEMRREMVTFHSVETVLRYAQALKDTSMADALLNWLNDKIAKAKEA